MSLKNISPKAIHQFDNMPVFWVVAFSLFSLGIYSLYWLFTRTQQLNKIHPKPIPFALVVSVVTVYVIFLLFSFSLDQQQTVEELPATTLQILNILTWAWLLLSNYWVILFYFKLLDIINAATGNDTKLGVDVILAVLFSAIFFQYKINQAQMGQPASSQASGADSREF